MLIDKYLMIIIICIIITILNEWILHQRVLCWFVKCKYIDYINFEVASSSFSYTHDVSVFCVVSELVVCVFFHEIPIPKKTLSSCASIQRISYYISVCIFRLFLPLLTPLFPHRTFPTEKMLKTPYYIKYWINRI